MFCLSEIALAFHHLLCRDEVHMKSQWLWIHLLLLFSTDNWLEQWNVCVCSLWNCTPCLFSGGLTPVSPPPHHHHLFFLVLLCWVFFVSFSLKLITGGACVKMASLTLCISMCHTASKALPANFCQGSMSAVFKNRVGLQQEDWQSQTPYTSYLKRSIYFTFSIKILIESSI